MNSSNKHISNPNAPASLMTPMDDHNLLPAIIMFGNLEAMKQKQVFYLELTGRALVIKGNEITSISPSHTDKIEAQIQCIGPPPGCFMGGVSVASLSLEDGTQKIFQVSNLKAVKRHGKKVVKIEFDSLASNAQGNYAETSTDLSDLYDQANVNLVIHQSLAPNSLLTLLENNPELSTLLAAIKAAGLTDLFSGDAQYTVFVPTNAAFNDLPAGTVENLLKPQNKQKLIDVLSYHVVQGKVYAEDVVKLKSAKTLLKNKKVKVRVTNGVVNLNNAKVVTADVEAENGVVHLIDKVLLPK